MIKFISYRADISLRAEHILYQHSKIAFGIFTLTLLLFLTILIPNQNAEAQLVCPERAIEQITDEPEGDSEDPSIDADGVCTAFESRADINGVNNGDNEEIYFFDRTTGIITQVTDEPEGE